MTLLELMVVMTLAAIATAAVALSLRDPDQQALQREAERLISRLESARSWSRSSGQTLRWSARDNAHQFSGYSPAQPAERWLQEGIEVQWTRPAAPGMLVLGPEPILAAQAITLQLRKQTLMIATDGLGPFEVRQP
jgi:general secretion pathway protein H